MNRTEAPYLPLTDATIAKHLLGGHHIGFYPLLDDDTCWRVALADALDATLNIALDADDTTVSFAATTPTQPDRQQVSATLSAVAVSHVDDDAVGRAG